MASAVDYLRLAMAFKDELDFTVWFNLSSNLNSISKLVEYTDGGDQFETYCRQIYSSIADRMGWQRKADESKMTRISLLLTTVKEETLAWISLSSDRI